jgi:hypothetical protein
MRKFPTLIPAQAAMKSGDTVWSKFIPPHPKSKRDFAMEYYVCALDSFLPLYLAMPPDDRLYCEMLPDDKPLKIYVDVEFKREESVNVDYEGRVARIIELVREAISMPGAKAFQVDASNDQKFSRHLTFDVAFAVKAQIKSLMKHVVAQDDDELGIDLSVYDKNRFMRIAFSHKLGQPTRKLLSLDRSVLPADVMARSLISHFMDGIRVVEWEAPLPPKKRRKKSTKRDQPPPPPPQSVDEALLAKAKDWLAQRYPDSVTSRERMFNNRLCLDLRPGIECFKAKKTHASNCTYFNLDAATMVGSWTCSDPGCSGARWGRFRVE